MYIVLFDARCFISLWAAQRLSGESWVYQLPRFILIGRLDIAVTVIEFIVCRRFEFVLRTVDLLAADSYGVLFSTLTQLP